MLIINESNYILVGLHSAGSQSTVDIFLFPRNCGRFGTSLMLDGENIKPLDKLLRMLYFPLAKFLVNLLYIIEHTSFPDDLFRNIEPSCRFFPIRSLVYKTLCCCDLQELFETILYCSILIPIESSFLSSFIFFLMSNAAITLKIKR